MLVTPAAPMSSADPSRETALLQKSRALEAAFLAEMLGHAGFGDARESFGGGIGEEQFGSFLRDEQARLMLEKGGIGLAEKLFRALSGPSDDR